jgi:hypothetical protein
MKGTERSKVGLNVSVVRWQLSGYKFGLCMRCVIHASSSCAPYPVMKRPTLVRVTSWRLFLNLAEFATYHL